MVAMGVDNDSAGARGRPALIGSTYAVSMAGAQAAGAENAFAAGLFEPLPARYDLLAGVLLFRSNRRWPLEMVRHVTAASPDRVLDVATGTAGGGVERATPTP